MGEESCALRGYRHLVAVLSTHRKHIASSLQIEIPNLGKGTLFCEADQYIVGELPESHTKPSANVAWHGQVSYQ